jgi:hypothetical protein
MVTKVNDLRKLLPENPDDAKRNQEEIILMPQYTGLQSILNAALGEYQSKGFHLVEEGDHITILFYRDERVAVFNQTRLTTMTLHEACASWLQKVGVS